ncbi:hypothetical protein EXIGLDRAFT_718625 [Exidia glandulosa HHB12029]|uniref:Uncharacterized protein n=1 Tax=Exidia glandulosa HHB12029 TaxID=1314781 RepID=A0A165HNU7_EXIGL|nr:hypothetical protein EXIGLDRAFT_718625 [Exidia glandulosa HHB12029]
MDMPPYDDSDLEEAYRLQDVNAAALRSDVEVPSHGICSLSVILGEYRHRPEPPVFLLQSIQVLQRVGLQLPQRSPTALSQSATAADAGK